MAETNGTEGRLARIDERTANTAKDVAEIKSMLGGYDDRLRCVETTQAKLGERVAIWQAAQGAYTTIAALVAAAFGSK